jgi:hypothetical protein
MSALDLYKPSGFHRAIASDENLPVNSLELDDMGVFVGDLPHKHPPHFYCLGGRNL